MAHIDSLYINIAIADMHCITYMILDVRNSLQNTNVPIYEIFFVSSPPKYLDWFEKYYSNTDINKYDRPFYLKLMNKIQVTNPYGRQLNRVPDTLVKIRK